MSRPIVLVSLVVAAVLALGAPAGASSVRSVPTADEPAIAVVASLVLGVGIVVMAVIVNIVGSKKRS